MHSEQLQSFDYESVCKTGSSDIPSPRARDKSNFDARAKIGSLESAWCTSSLFLVCVLMITLVANLVKQQSDRGEPNKLVTVLFMNFPALENTADD